MNTIKLKLSKLKDKILGNETIQKIMKFFSIGERKFILQLYLLAIGVFCVTLFQNELTIVLSGDFYLQQIPFYHNGYDDWWTFLSTGQFPMWDESGFLGSNNIGANAFYYLLNIFFLPILIFPRELIPQGLAFLIITKFVLAGYVMKKLLKYINVSEKSSSFVAMAYAFSGWSLFYLWFNHFLEISILLPLVILGLEKLFKERKVVFLILSLFLSAVTNYYFFIMICFTTVLYAIYRFLQYAKTYSKKDLFLVMGLGVLSYVIALSMALVILIPCFKVALESSRVNMEDTNTFTGRLLEALKLVKTTWELKDYSASFIHLEKVFKICTVFEEDYNLKVYAYPIVSYFYPPSSCYDSILFNNTYYDNTNSSLFIYTPLMLLMLPSFIVSIKEKKALHLVALGVILVLLFTPFAYYCFTGFTTVCYGRWELFVVVVACMFVATNLDKLDKMKKWHIDISFLISIGCQLFMFYIGYKTQGQMGTSKLSGTEYYAIIMILYLVFIYHVVRRNIKDKGLVGKLNKLTMLEILVVGNVCVICQGIPDISDDLYGGYQNVATEEKLIKEIDRLDDGYYRIYNSSADRDANNMGMLEGYRGTGTFHSIYNYNLQDFIDRSRISYGWQGWSMGMHEKKLDLDSFVNIKYYLLDKSDKNIPFGYEKILELDNKVVYENKNFVEFGFAFDTILTDNQIYYSDTMDNSNQYSSYKARAILNETLLTRYAILESEVAKDVAEENNLDYETYVTAEDYKKITTVVYPANEDIIIKRAIWDVKEKGKMDGYEKDVIYSKSKATGLKWESKLLVDLSKYEVAPEAKERGGAYVTVKAHMGDNLIIKLYGTNAEGKEYLLTEDDHMRHGYSSTNDRKYERGFYVKDRVTRMEMVIKDTLSSKDFIYRPDITYQYYDTYKANIDKLNENPITDLEIGVNDFKFKTNYNKKKFVVLTIPYDQGWKLKVTNKEGLTVERETYRAQGGFIGFVADGGEASYKLSYFTPGLKEGAIGLIVGTFLLGCLYIGFELGDQDKKRIKKQLAL